MIEETESQFLRRLLKEAAAKSRGYAGFWDWPNRTEREVGIVLDLFQNIHAKEGLLFTQLRSTGAGNDPPDCEADTPDGQRLGIEVSEMVDRAAIAMHKAGHVYHWAEWNREKFLRFLTDRVSAKDKPDKVKGGPFSEYWLLVHTDEPELSFERVSAFLQDLKPYETKLLSRIVLLLSYSPQHNGYPYINIPVERAV